MLQSNCVSFYHQDEGRQHRRRQRGRKRETLDKKKVHSIRKEGTREFPLPSRKHARALVWCGGDHRNRITC